MRGSATPSLGQASFCKKFSKHAPATITPFPSADVEESTTGTPDLSVPVNTTTNSTETDKQADVEESTTGIPETPDLSAPVNLTSDSTDREEEKAGMEDDSTTTTPEAPPHPPAPVNATDDSTDSTDSGEQVNHPEGFGVNVYDDSYDGSSRTPTATNDEDDIGRFSWSDVDQSLLPELLYALPRRLHAHGWTGYVRFRFVRVENVIIEAVGGTSLWGGPAQLLMLPRPEEAPYATDIAMSSNVLASHSPVILDVKLITLSIWVPDLGKEPGGRFLRTLGRPTAQYPYGDATGITMALTVAISHAPVVVEFTCLTLRAGVHGASHSPAVIDFQRLTLRAGVHGLDEEPDRRSLRTTGRQIEQTAIVDLPPPRLDGYCVHGPALDTVGDNEVSRQANIGDQTTTARSTFDMDEGDQANIGDPHQMLVGTVHVVGPTVNMNGDDQHSTYVLAAIVDRSPTPWEAVRVVGPTLHMGDDDQAAIGDYTPMPGPVLHMDDDDDDDGDDQVCRGSVWATELIDRAEGAEPRCAVGAAPLEDTPNAVPARASTSRSGDDDVRPCLSVRMTALLRRVWSWVHICAFACVGMQLASLSYSATFPLRVGGKLHPRTEYMPYWRRFLAVSILRVRAKHYGDTMAFRMFQLRLGLRVLQLWGTWPAYVVAAVMMSTTYLAKRLRYWRCPYWQWAAGGFIDAYTAELLYQYFAAKVVGEDGKELEYIENTHDTCTLAQFPLSIADAMQGLLGVRGAGTGAAKSMVRDDREGVAVIKIAPEEPAVFTSKDASALTRPLVTMACEGQGSVTPMYVFGATRPHELPPPPKLPGLIFRGVFGLVSYRQQLTLAVGRPIQVWNGSRKDVATLKTCVSVEEAMRTLAANNRPEWEKREALFTRGPVGW